MPWWNRSNERLRKQAEDLGAVMPEYLLEFARQVQAILDDVSFDDGREPTRHVLQETVGLSLHLLDRAAFQLLGAKKQEVFIDNFLPAVAAAMKHVVSEDLLRATYNSFQSVYSVCSGLVPAKDESPKNTVCWEFGKRLASNPATIAILFAAAAENYTALVRTLHGLQVG
jgi:hypothetical protein